MLLQPLTGWGGIQKRDKEEIIILASSLHRIQKDGLRFVFTDSHAKTAYANFYDDIKDLNKIDWDLLQRRDFKRDQNDIKKFERYQAEALIYKTCPTSSLMGVICYTEQVGTVLSQQIRTHDLNLPVHVRPHWYF